MTDNDVSFRQWIKVRDRIIRQRRASHAEVELGTGATPFPLGDIGRRPILWQ